MYFLDTVNSYGEADYREEGETLTQWEMAEEERLSRQATLRETHKSVKSNPLHNPRFFRVAQGYALSQGYTLYKSQWLDLSDRVRNLGDDWKLDLAEWLEHHRTKFTG